MEQGNTSRLPAWIRARSPLGAGTEGVRAVLAHYRLNTVCQSAACPNLGQCFAEGTAAFMILGRRCTRDCRFCAVEHGPPEPLDASEPERVALATRDLDLRHLVITSVTRDDLPDGGAVHFAAVVRAVRALCPDLSIEVLTPDFQGDREAITAVVAARPEIYNHNVETVPRLYPAVRPGADYGRSLALLGFIKDLDRSVATKSGLMLGLGEEEPEVLDVLRDLRRAGCGMLTLGQYLRPSREHLPVAAYIEPGRFAELGRLAGDMGFRHVSSGPLVRSSFHAAEGMKIG